jgi:hypothetical protein
MMQRLMTPTVPVMWSLSNRFSVIQQYFATCWGGLRQQAALVLAPALAVQTESQAAKRTRRATE